MALTRVSPSLFATSNNITSVTVGGSANTISLTFDGSGVITAASNNALSVANTLITGNIISSQITSVANTQITGNIISSQIASVSGSVITANTIANSAIQTGAVENYMNAAGLGFGMRNRIINGAMVIDQRNAGASVTPTNGQYTLDRFAISIGGGETGKLSIQQNAGSVTPPAGFVNYLGVTSLSAYTVPTANWFSLLHEIEGLNVGDLAWGTASAATITLSFWVRSSLTGTFGGALNNSGNARNYPYTYTISTANTWEKKSITIAGDTSGTWLTTNGVGIQVGFALGAGTTESGTAGAWTATRAFSATGATSVVGTNGATWYITGVQLEKGSTATSFDYRPYGTELALCQRYYEKSFAQGTAPGYNEAYNFTIGALYVGTSISIPIIPFKVTKRAAPTMVMYGVSTSGWKYYAGGFSNLSSFTGAATDSYFYAEGSGTSGLSQYQSTIIGGNWTASAEL